MGSRSTRVTQPDAVVLHCSAVLFDKLNAVQNFTSGLLHFAELVHVVPEFGLGNNCVGCEDDHAIGFRVGVVVSRSLAADDLELFHYTSDSHDYSVTAVRSKAIVLESRRAVTNP